MSLAVAKTDAHVESKTDQAQAHTWAFWAPSCCSPHEVGSGVKGEMDKEGPAGTLALRSEVVGEFAVLSFVTVSTISLGCIVVKYT